MILPRPLARRSSLASLTPDRPSPSPTARLALITLGLGLTLGIAGSPSSSATELRLDFGSPDSPTQGGGAAESRSWNNLTGTVASTDSGILESLVATDGTPSDLYLAMISRFNGVNENGTLSSSVFPASATRDSLYGNTEAFGGLENVTPIFALGGLVPGTTYRLTFYASRTGVSDNRETRYTVTGGTEVVADLDASNNLDTTVTVDSIQPSAGGEITIALSPGPNNNNANHFVYLGALRLDTVTPGGPSYLIDAGGGNTTDLEVPPPPIQWNNLTTSLGATQDGELPGLVTTNGTETAVRLQMLSRFNGANVNGTTASTRFPASATGDSLFGNTETFSGLADVFPRFKLAGLGADAVYSFTFHASRTGVSDNRETRFTVTGATTATADLNAANNVDDTATVSRIAPDAAGEITIALSPGPNNNNANHFTYLGTLIVNWEPAPRPRVLIDFGASGTPTEFGASDPLNHWNNVTPAIGGSDSGVLSNLVSISGAPTGFGLQMVARFNGANENGTTESPDLPVAATRDSLFGNTEAFSGLENVFPVFKLTGLASSTAYDVTFFASRTGVGDNRETTYTITGATTQAVHLDPANNIDQSVTVPGIQPDSSGALTLALTPGENNSNGNHFTYLGVLRLDWTPSTPPTPATLSEPSFAADAFRFRLTGTAGHTYSLQRTGDFTQWSTVRSITLNSASEVVEVTPTGDVSFYRVAE